MALTLEKGFMGVFEFSFSKNFYRENTLNNINTTSQHTNVDSYFYGVTLICVIIYILTNVILNYSVNWMHPEVIIRAMRSALVNGIDFQLADLGQIFDFNTLDGVSRARFVSYAFEIIDVKFRLWLFQYIPPHPSLSLTYIFIFLSPVLLFKFINNVTNNRNTAWSAVLLYVLSTGFLSGSTLLFHAGKPIANFFVIYCLYLASKLSRLAANQHKFRKNEYFSLLLFFCVLFITLFTDEGAYFVLVALPILFYDDILKFSLKTDGYFSITKRLPEMTFEIASKPGGISMIVLYLLTFVLYLIFITFVFPIIALKMGLGTFNFWGFVGSGSSLLDNVLNFNFTAANARDLVTTQLIPISTPYLAYFYTVYYAYFLWMFTHLTRFQKRIFFRYVIVLILFFIFQTLLFSTHGGGRVVSTYYYGSTFPIYLVLPLSILLSVKGRWLKSANKAVLIFLLIVSAHNFPVVSHQWMGRHNAMYRQFFPEETKMMHDRFQTLSYDMVVKAWQTRKDQKALSELKPLFPVISYGLFVELELMELKESDLEEYVNRKLVLH